MLIEDNRAYYKGGIYMKKVLSVALMFCILCSMLSSFSFIGAAEAEGMYSGGSGTEDDPYLISDRHDISEMYNSIINETSLWSEKKYYKLTNNIATKEPFSPLYEFEGYGMDCFVTSPYNVNYILRTFEFYDYPPNKYNEYNEKIFAEITAAMGYLYAHDDEDEYDVCTSAFDLYESCFFIQDRPGRFTFKDYNLYRRAAFTGVFDGNGYTIYGNNLCLFGFLENGAEIKNLKISGEDLSLAYYVGEDCNVTDCTFNVTNGKALTYVSGYYTEVDTNSSNPYKTFEEYSTENGIIHNNHGTVSQCINKKDLSLGFVGKNEGSVCDILSYGKIEGLSPKDKGMQRFLVPEADGNTADDEIYTSAECDGADGDPSIYKGFDFSRIWIMKEGVPFLRMGLESGTGDVNLDGLVNSIDSNFLRRFHAEDHTVSESIYPFAGDMDKNDRLDAIDSIRLILYIIGK